MAREPSARLAGRPTWNRSRDTEAHGSPHVARRARAPAPARRGRPRRRAGHPRRARGRALVGTAGRTARPRGAAGARGRFAIVVDGAVAGWLACEENTDPMYRSVGLDIFLTTPLHGQGLGREALRLAIAHYLERGHHRFTIDPARTTSARSAPTRPSASSPSGACATTSSAPTAPGTTGCYGPAAHGEFVRRGTAQHPIENIASRSWREKTSKATIVWVRLTPGSLTQPPGDDVGQHLVARHADDGDEVPLAGDRVGLGHAVEVGQRAAERGHRVALGLDEHDRGGHGVCVSPGSSTTTSA